jgi:3-oxoacyl-[acyl-carrier-protein] synthase-3
MIRSICLGVGGHLPEKVLTNDDLARMVDTSDEWIVQRTGISQRHIAAEDETTSDLALAAARKALAAAEREAKDIDLIILATATPDHSFPATAMRVQAELGLPGVTAFDIAAACSGFVYALATADKFIASGSHKRALVIGAETLSKITDWTDRGTCVLFGDGAGAMVLEAGEGAGTIKDRGVLGTHLHGDGRHYDDLFANPKVFMNGREIYKQAVVHLSEVMDEALAAHGLTADDLDLVVPHQANRRIIDSSAEKLKFPLEKVIVTIDKHGNTSAASVPLALDSAVSLGRLGIGDLVLLNAMGGGLTWGAALLRW